MGVSSDGILYFGFQVGGEDEAPEWLGDESDFDDWLAVKAGLDGAPYAERTAAIKTCPAELQLFCSYDYPMYVLAIRGAEHRVSRGDIKEIGAADLTVAQEKIDVFKAWCAANNIEYQEPKWLLCSMYG